MQRRWTLIVVLVFAVGATPAALAQVARVVNPPDPAQFYQNTSFAIDGTVGYVPSFDNDTLWSFSLVTGALLDPDGLPLPAPGTASDAYLFPNDRLVIPGWFPAQGVYVVDISDPRNLVAVGAIDFGQGVNIQGQNVEVDASGYIGYVASFPNDTLYSFNIQAMKFEDPDGLTLPGNPDRIALAGTRLAIVDTTNGRIMVADVSDPRNLTLAGVITLPGVNTFGSNDNIVFAADGRTGFVSSNERVLYSFDVITLTLLDPDGLTFGTQLYGDDIAIHGSTVACLWSRGLAFVDVSDPYNLRLISNANFGGTVAPQGSATVAFTADGRAVATSVIYPDDYVYTFDVATGQQIAPRFKVDDEPNYLTIFGATDRVGVVCSGTNADNIWLIDGLFGFITGDLNCDRRIDFGDINPFVLALTNPAAYQAAFPNCSLRTGDINGDGHTNFGDINPFVALLTAP